MSASITTIPTAYAVAREEHFALNGAESAEGAAPRTRLRLTRRGRAVSGMLFALVVLAVLAVVAVFGSSQAVASAEVGDADFGYVVVQPGGSLWDVASEIDPSVDPRDLVAEIVRLNNLEGSGVQAGQPIALPLRYADVEGAVSAEELGI